MAKFTAMVPVTIECDNEEQAAAIFEEFCDAGYNGMLAPEDMQRDLEISVVPSITIGFADWKKN
jgi:hypothetical protein